MFEKVLAAIDGSPAAYHAAIIGAQLTAPTSGSLELVCVAEGLREQEVRGSAKHDHDEEILGQCNADLSSAQAAIGSLAVVRERRILLGRTAEAILDCALESGAELVCVGRGRQRLKLGSVSSAIVRRAEIPVVVVPSGVSTGPKLRRLLLGFDGSSFARRAARRVGSIAAELGAEVWIEFVLASPWPLPAEGVEVSDEELARLAGSDLMAELNDAREIVEGQGGKVAFAGFDLGEAAVRLLSRADVWNADLIVVGATGQSPARRFILGGVSDHLVSRSTRPVLVFR